MTSQQPKSPLSFNRTGPIPCPYLAGHVERNLFAELGGSAGTLPSPAIELHDRLTEAGFRRSHTIVYKPACPNCDACVPVRVPVARFRTTRSLRRIANKNSDLETRIVAPLATEEQFRLFMRYQQARHGGGDMAAMEYCDYQAMVADAFGETKLIELRDGEAKLVAVCLTDFLQHAVSAVYSFFDPDLKARSLGSFIVLSLIREAALSHRAHVYLGYWIAASRKMAYKTRFQPLEALGPAGWKPLDPTRDPTLEPTRGHFIV